MSTELESPVRTHRFSRERYERMIDAGVFGSTDRVELLDGEIVEMAPQKSRHATAVTLIADRLRRIADAVGGCFVRTQLPLALDANSEPEPDVAVVDGSVLDYSDEHPRAARLVVEVGDASLAYDRGRKLAAYARAGIAEYWILDLAAATLEVRRQCEGERYARLEKLAAGDTVHWGGQAIRVADLLPR